MKAMIFAAGLGTRLRPLTDHTPKALLSLGGRPMLGHVIDHMVHAGVTDLTVNVHHHARQVVDWLASHSDDWPSLSVHISDESDALLDTGGGLLHARNFLQGGEPVLLHNADILTDLDLGALYRSHLKSGACATLLVQHRQTSRYLLMDSNLRLRGWINKATGEVRPQGLQPDNNWTEWAFGGVHVVSPTLIDRMEAEGWTGSFGLIPFYLSVCDRVPLMGYTASENTVWFDIGRPQTLRQAQERLAMKTQRL